MHTRHDPQAAISSARAGQEAAPNASVTVQLIAHEARPLGRLGDKRAVTAALDRGRKLLHGVPLAANMVNHFGGVWFRRAGRGVNGGDVGAHRYRIMVSGGLDEAGREVFGDFVIEPAGEDTVLTCDLDQAALYGALNRIQRLGLDLIEVRRLASGAS